MAGVTPDEVTPTDVSTGAVRTALGATDPVVRQRGARVCDALADQDAERVLPLVEPLADLATDESLAVVQAALSALRTTAAAEPEVLDGALGPVATAAATASLPGIRLSCAEVFAAVAADRPDLCAPHAARLVDVLSEEGGDAGDATVPDSVRQSETRELIERQERAAAQQDRTARHLLANVVVATAEADPVAVEPALADLEALLDATDPAVAGAALDALTACVRGGAGDVTPDERLLDCLDRESQVVRARAVRLLGFLGDDAVVPELRRVAASDPDDDVAELAAATATHLSD